MSILKINPNPPYMNKKTTARNTAMFLINSTFDSMDKDTFIP